MKNQLLKLFTGICLLGFFGCKKKLDICEGKKQVSAGFKMYQTISDGGSIRSKIEVDTILRAQYVNFEAEANPVTKSYSWKIGNDPRPFTEAKTGLLFDVLGTISVRLAVKGTAQPECFVGDDGIDTLRKSFVIVPQQQAVFLGTFEGYSSDAPTQKKTLTIVWHPRTHRIYPDVIRLYGLEPLCGTSGMPEPYNYSADIVSYVYKGFIFDGGGAPSDGNYPACATYLGTGIVENGNKLILKYKYQQIGSALVEERNLIAYRKP